MLVHSYLYYVMDHNIVDDGTWQKWADELTELQKEKHDIGFYDEAFRDWNGSTGMHLPRDQWIIDRCKKIVSGEFFSVH